MGLGPGERSVILHSFTVIRGKSAGEDERDNELIMIETPIIVSKVTDRQDRSQHNRI